jgi:4-alpha-glucanotransferase
VPAHAPTAETGEWRLGPGADFFQFVRNRFEGVPFVAEDLGLITENVIALRDAFDLPGMRVMQFGFDDQQDDHPFRPHTFPERCVAYLGTHDNDTTRGWYDQTDDSVRHRVRSYFSTTDEDAVHAMMRGLFSSRAARVFVTPQDLLELGTEARMNAPGHAGGNWSWRMTSAQLEDASMWQTLAALNQEFDR